MKHTNVGKSKFFTIDQYIFDTINSLSFEQNEQIQIENMTYELINFQKLCCLNDSNLSVNVILAASFYAWKCIKIEERSKITLNQFLVRFKIKCYLHRYVCKLMNLLIDLCKLIPWIIDKKRINKKTIYFYTQDLIDHSSTIIADYRKLKQNEFDKKICQTNDRPIDLKRERDEFMDDKSEIGLSNIPDSEIDCYIRSDEEVRLLKKLKNNQFEFV